MLLDEPSLGLSPKLTREIFEIVVRINRERGTTILLVEQNANMALNVADYGYVLETGRIVAEDSCAALREKDDIKEFYRHEGRRRARRTALETAQDGAERRARRRVTMQSESHQYRPGSGSRGEPLSERAFDTVPRLFWHAVRGDAVMMRQKDFGVWRAYGWREVGEIVADVAAGLAALGCAGRGGLGAVQHPARMGLDRPRRAERGRGGQRHLSDRRAGPGRVPVRRLGHRLPLRRERGAARQVLEVRARLPRVRKVVVYDMEGLAALDDPAILAFDALLAQGGRRARSPAGGGTAGAAGPDDVAVLVYTSGTTGRPKGAMLSHRNILRSCLTLRDFLPAAPLGERMCFLPLCHVAERIFGEYHAILLGAVMNFAESPDTVFDNLREIQPDVFMAVPRVWEKLYSSVVIALREATPLQRRAYALRAGRARGIEAGRALPARTRGGLAGRCAGAGQCAAHDGPRPHPHGRHRRGADLARPDPLVHGAGHRRS